MGTRRFYVNVVTIADGYATADSPYLSGKIASIHYVKAGANNYTDGVDFAITAEATGEGLWTESNVNASASRYPRSPTHTQAGVASLYAAGGTAVQDLIRLSRDRVKIVLAQGGNATTGAFTIVVED